MKASVNWQHELSFTGEADSGFTLPLGADVEVGGANDGFKPLELMAMSVAGCTAMDVISILLKKKQEVTSFQVNVTANQASEFPKVFTHVVISYQITGHSVDEAAVLRSIELSATKYCPAQAMLGKVVPMDLVYQIYEDEGGGKKSLSRQGNYLPQGE
jgi:putative redox protein